MKCRHPDVQTDYRSCLQIKCRYDLWNVFVNWFHTLFIFHIIYLCPLLLLLKVIIFSSASVERVCARIPNCSMNRSTYSDHSYFAIPTATLDLK